MLLMIIQLSDMKDNNLQVKNFSVNHGKWQHHRNPQHMKQTHTGLYDNDRFQLLTCSLPLQYPNAAAKATSEAGVTFALFAKGMTALLGRSWALCYVRIRNDST